MVVEKKLGSGIFISAEHFIPAFLLATASFLKSFGIALTDAGSSVLFLSFFGGHYIPAFIISAAFLIFFCWALLFYIKDKSPQTPTYVMLGIGLLSFASYFIIGSSKYSAFGLMVWKEAVRIGAETAFWIIAFRFGLFKRNPRTLFAVLMAQATAILGAAGLVRVTAYTKDPTDLILWGALLLLAAVPPFQTLIANQNAPISERFAFTKQKINRSGADAAQKKLYFAFFAFAGLLFFTAGIFDYYFLTSVVSAFGADAAAIAKTFSVVLAALSGLCFILMFFLVRGQNNVFFLLYLFPAALVMAVLGGFFAIFGLIVTAKTVFMLASLESREATLQTAPFAISVRSAFRATIFRKAIVEPSSFLAAGLFLLWAENYMTEQHFLWFAVGLAVLLTAVLIVFRQTYVKIILNLLKNHLWRGGRLNLIGRRVRKALLSSLTHSNGDETVYALRMLEESMTPAFPAQLKKALEHSDADVRLYALEKIEALNFTSVTNKISDLARNDPDPRIRSAALRVLCDFGNGETREKVTEYIEEPILQNGALTGLLSVGREGVFEAIEKVSSMAVSPDPSERAQAAEILGNAGNAAFYQPLIRLLNDENETVCQKALIAAGRLCHPALLPAVTDAFRYPDLREDGVETLLKFKNKIFPVVEKILRSTDYPVQFRILLAKMLSRLPSPETERFLFKQITVADRRVRFHIFKSLIRLNHKATGRHINAVRLSLYDEIEEATNILAALEAFDKNTDATLTTPISILQAALNEETDQVKERILQLLALLQPTKTMREFMDRYTSETKQNHEQMEHIVEKSLTGELRTVCLPLFSQKTTHEKLVLLRPHFMPPVLTIDGYVNDLLTGESGTISDWTRSCAAYVAGFLKNKSAVDPLVGLLNDPDPLVRETAVWAIGKILPQKEAARLIAGNLNDYTGSVARMARFVSDGAGKIAF